MIFKIKNLVSFSLVLFFLTNLSVYGQDVTMTDFEADKKIEKTITDTSSEKTVENIIKKDSLLSISGSIDTYFRKNLNGNFEDAPATAFANLPGFSLGMANLIASVEGKKVGFTADFVFGPRGEDAVFASPLYTPEGGSSRIINQLYAFWNITDNVTATIGNFNTFLGYEVISPTENFNYSTTYMFSYGPFSHTGLKLDFDLGKGFSLMTGVFNPTDYTEFNPGRLNGNNELEGVYVGCAQLGYSSNKGSAFLNAIVSDGFYQLDLTAGMDVSDKVYVGVNATTASDLFFGAAAYLQVAATDDFKIGARAEYFGDQGIGLTTLDESILDLTLSANYSIGNLTLIPEFRLDIFSDENTESLSSVLVAVVYKF